MTRYALFLRGINVGGVRVPMAELRAVLEAAGSRSVRTWLNTGNVALDDDRDASTLCAEVEANLTSAFGYEAHVIVRPADALAELVAAWPFGDDAEHHRYVVFGGAVAADAAQEALREAPTATADEGVAVVGPDLMWRCPKGTTTTSPVARALARSTARADTTTRNLNTIEKMLLP